MLQNLAENAQRLLFATVACRHVNIHAHCTFVHELTAKATGDGNEQSGEHRKIDAPRPDQGSGVVDPKQPIERSQREQHHRKNGVAPCGNQAADTWHSNQIDQAYGARNPAAQGANSGKPETGARPEIIIAQQIGDIRRHQPNQGRNWKVNQHRMNRMTADGHFAHDGLRGFISAGFMSLIFNRFVHLTHLPVGFLLFILLILPLLTGCTGPLSALDPAGPSARSAALLWWSMFAYATVVLVAVVALWLYAMRRPQDTRDETQQRRTHNRWIIGGGVILPTVSILLLLVFGVPMGHRMLPLPPAEGEAFRIEVTGHQWWWEVRYPDSTIVLKNELHIPAGTPIDIHLSTADVIHGFWVPRLGGKLDAIPGRVNVLRLQADKPGVYRGQCAEFCGLHHAGMQFTVTAHLPEDFTRWIEAQTQ